MSDHADTIRREDAMIEHLRHYLKPEPALVATLDAFLAERRQAQEERDAALTRMDIYREELRKANGACQQAIDALREIANPMRSRTPPTNPREARENVAAAASWHLRKIARAALVKLGEQP